MPAREPRSEDLYEIMQGSDPAAATQAFNRFLTTPGEWWKGDTPFGWARRTAKRAVDKFAHANWPVHQLDEPDAIANYALILLGQKARGINSPPGFLYRVIHNTIYWQLTGKLRDGEPWAHEPEEVLDWKVTPSSRGASIKLWSNPAFCESVARALNSLSDTLRPYAILNLLEAMRPVDIAAHLDVDSAMARQYCLRALQAIAGRKDVHKLKQLGDTRTIRLALALGRYRTIPSDDDPPGTD